MEHLKLKTQKIKVYDRDQLNQNYSKELAKVERGR